MLEENGEKRKHTQRRVYNLLEYLFLLLDLNFYSYIQAIYKIGLSCCVRRSKKVRKKTFFDILDYQNFKFEMVDRD